MDRFVNDDIFVTSQRTASFITEQELKQKLCDAVRIHCDDYDYQDYLDNIEDFGIDEEDPLPWGQAVSTLLNCSDRIYEAKDVCVDHENIELEWDGWRAHCSGTCEPAEYLGIHTINGFTFCGVLTSGDWEWPIFAILYWDGKDIQIYIPKRGNKVNVDAMTAFGSEGEHLGPFCGKLYSNGKQLCEAYSQMGFKLNVNDPDWSGLYAKKYGFTEVEDIAYNWDAMMEEVFSNFVIVDSEN